MKIKYIGVFNKNFKIRIQPNNYLLKRFKERLNLFTQSSADPILKDHALKGSKEGLRAFSITGDIRVVYFFKGETVMFINIGTHEQVY